MSLALDIDWTRPDFQLTVDGEFPSSGITALFGRSGSGKTTLLRCIVGLERAPGACVRFNGEVWQDQRTFVPTYLRPLGYVFQESSLFAHLDARANLASGLKRVPAASRCASGRSGRVSNSWIGPKACKRPASSNAM